MAIYDFFLSRNSSTITANTYIGHAGRLFYDPAERVLRISDGVTAGGEVFNGIVTVANTEPTANFQGQLWLNPQTSELSVYHNSDFIPTIDVATESKLGGVKLGPGVTTNSEGQIIIDSTGLDFSFGDFASTVGTYTAGHPNEGDDFAILQTVNPNEDAILASNGTGSIKLVGAFSIYPANGSVAGSMLELPVLSVSADGDISARSLDVQETGDLGLMAALNVTINADGLTKTPAVVTGSVAQFTGRDDRTALLVLDTYGTDTTTGLTGGEFVFRTGRGTNASTTAVQSGDRLGHVTAAGWASNGYGGIGVGGLRILANENFTATARGSKLELYVIPNGTLTVTTIATVDSVGVTTDRLVKARNYEGAVRDVGSVGGTTVTLDWAADHMVHCVFTDNFTIAFSNYTAGRTITLIATNTSGFDTDIITAGISSVRMQGDSTLTVTQQTTAIITYYCVGTTVNDVYASAVYA